MKRKIINLFLALVLSAGVVMGSAQIVNATPPAEGCVVCIAPFGKPLLPDITGD